MSNPGKVLTTVTYDAKGAPTIRPAEGLTIAELMRGCIDTGNALGWDMGWKAGYQKGWKAALDMKDPAVKKAFTEFADTAYRAGWEAAAGALTTESSRLLQLAVAQVAAGGPEAAALLLPEEVTSYKADGSVLTRVIRKRTG